MTAYVKIQTKTRAETLNSGTIELSKTSRNEWVLEKKLSIRELCASFTIRNTAGAAPSSEPADLAMMSATSRTRTRKSTRIHVLRK
jgi:hypothetical protein